MVKDKKFIYIKRNLLKVNNYCKHGDLEIGSKRYIDGEKNKKNLCEKCSSEILEQKGNINIDRSNYLHVIDILKNSNKKISEDLLALWYPYLYKNIILLPGKYYREKIYLFLNDLMEPPKCECGGVIAFNNKKNCYKEKCEKCNRSEAVKVSSNIKSLDGWNDILLNEFNINLPFQINEKSIIINKISISKRDIHGLRKNGILHHSLINPSEFNLEIHVKNLQENWNSYKNLNESTIKRKQPGIWYALKLKSKEYNFNSFGELKFLVKNNGKRVKCSICEKNTSYNKSCQRYNINCDKHKYILFRSTAEKEISTYIESIYYNKIEFNSRSIISKELDIYIPKHKLAIEYNGLYWHSEKYKESSYHYDKWKECLDNGIKLFTIWEDDWNNKRDLMKEMILNQLGLNQNRIYARKCRIELVDNKIKKTFLEKNHIQGNANSSISLGLFYKNELVSLMTFGKKRMILKSKSHKEGEYELLRFCSKTNTSVIGGASKLFSHFLKKYISTSIISYANCDISNGNLYNILGFKNMGHTGLNYWWAKDGMKYHRSNFMKHKLVKEGADASKTENEIMIEKGYNKIWGTGNLKYEYII